MFFHFHSILMEAKTSEKSNGLTVAGQANSSAAISFSLISKSVSENSSDTVAEFNEPILQILKPLFLLSALVASSLLFLEG